VPILRRYITSEKERVDDVCKHFATIVDCATRTATFLSLEAKTYSAVSLDRSYDDGIAAIAADAACVGAKSHLVIRHASLGQRRVDGQLIDGYTTFQEQSFVSNLLSVTTTETRTYYFPADAATHTRLRRRRSAVALGLWITMEL